MKKCFSVFLALMLTCLWIVPVWASGHASTIQSIHSSFVSGNRSASGAPQQAVNGAYRCVELLTAIAYALDR